MSDVRYVNKDGWTVDCTQVIAGRGPEVWSLIVMMDDERVNKKSQLMRAEDFDQGDSELVFETDTWISSFWVSPDGMVHACNGRTHMYGRPGEDFTSEGGLSERLVFRPWGLTGDDLFILGDDGLVLRGRPGDWSDISLADGRRLLAIDGVTEQSLYAVGSDGAFCHLVEGAWTTIDLGTDVDLRAILVEEDGSVYICGADGTALRYARGEATFYRAEPDRYFGGVCRFRGAVYFGASGAGVEILDGDTIVPFKPNVYGQRLSTNGQFLWACGGNEICRFDGTAWLAEEFG